jgi:iron complex transport system substrate-binding protein
MFVVGRTPARLDGMIAVGRGSYLNELIRIAGGRNVLFDSPVTYPKISLEAVLRLAPDVIVDMGDMAATTGVTEAHRQSVVKLWETQPTVKAVTAKKVFAVAADIFVVPGPRVVEAAEAFAAMLK